MKKIIITIVIFLGTLNIVFTQSRWTNNYLDGEDPFAEDVIKHYDDGFLLSGRYGPNYPEYCWLIKTDINGEVLWKKILGNDSDFIVISADLATNNSGNIYMVGSTNTYSYANYDPVIMKLDSCGEKEWCIVFIEDGDNYIPTIVNTEDNGVVAILHYMNPDVSRDRICLAKLSSEGELLWKQCYNSEDTCLNNQDAYDLIVTPDNGFLITGICYYQETDPPYAFRKKPYYIKTDSLGNFQWETVVHKGLKSPGGYAWTTILNTDSSAYYSALAHKYYDPATYKAALLKMDLNGNVDTIYDLNTNDNITSLYGNNFINDSLIMGAATWNYGNTDDRKAVIIDTIGNIINSAHLIDDIYTTKTAVTNDNKILYLTSTVDQNDNFSTYLFKLNQLLESDTIYTAQYTYDSLCPYQIASDTIVQDDCGLIVGMEEIKPEKEEDQAAIKIYPNPTKSIFNISIPGLNENEFTNSTCIIEIFDIYGRKVKEIIIPKGQNTIEVNVGGWRKGLYLVRARAGQSIVGSVKVVVN